MSKYTPNGLSILQIKKDAKKLKKESNISLSEARNQIIQNYTDFNSWNDMMKYFSKFGSINNVFKLKNPNGTNHKIKTYQEKPINIIIARPGSGKSSIVNQIVNNNKNKYLICNINKIELKYYKESSDLISFEYSKKANELHSKSRWLAVNTDIKQIIRIATEKKVNVIVLDEYHRMIYNDEIGNKIKFHLLTDFCIKNDITILLVSQISRNAENYYIEPFSSNIIDMDDVKLKPYPYAIENLKLINKIENKIEFFSTIIDKEIIENQERIIKKHLK